MKLKKLWKFVITRNDHLADKANVIVFIQVEPPRKMNWKSKRKNSIDPVSTANRDSGKKFKNTTPKWATRQATPFTKIRKESASTICISLGRHKSEIGFLGCHRYIIFALIIQSN